jgi:plasmid maintenance system antidote protein VapI
MQGKKMKLEEYLKKRNVNKAAFCRSLGINPVTLYRILNNQTDMLLSLALRIEKETLNEVTVTDLMEEKTVDQINSEGVKRQQQRKKNADNRPSS